MRRNWHMKLWLTICLVTLIGSQTLTQDWPQFLGPGRDGRYEGLPINFNWPTGSPTEIWRKPVGEGFAGPIVIGNVLILFHRIEDQEVVEALDATSGHKIWSHGYSTTYRDDFGFDEGPRSVPVVSNGKVFTFGAQGKLQALNVETGETLWEVDTKTRFGFRKAFFGSAGSPLVEGQNVIVNIGGQNAGIVAFDKDSGSPIWTSTTDEASYSSPVAATFGGKRHAVVLTRNGLIGLDPLTGEVRFERRWRSRLRASVNAATPLVIEDVVFASATYGTGAVALRVRGTDLEELWSSDEVMSNHYATSVYRDGYLYGFHGRQEYNPSFRSVHLLTGEVQWNVDAFRAGTVTLAGDRLIIVLETGELLVAEASPKAFTPLARVRILPPVIRAYPALANGLLYVRNENTLVCFDLR